MIWQKMFNLFCLSLMVLNILSLTLGAPQLPSTTSSAENGISSTSSSSFSSQGTTQTTPSGPRATNSFPGVTGTTPSYYPTTTPSRVSPTSGTTGPVGTQPSQSEEDKRLSDCNTPSTLENYCEDTLTPQEKAFFKNDTSIIGVLALMIKPHIVYALREKCVPGNWCLPDKYQQEISEGKNYFYTTPLCRSDNFWRCLQTIEIQRKQCNESELFFLMSTVGLLCDMEVIEGGYISSECYTRSVEAIHVLYSDLSRSVEAFNNQEVCNNYSKQMTNTYQCAVQSCDMEQRIFLADFGPWSIISSRADQIGRQCQLQLQCPDSEKTVTVSGSSSNSSSSNTEDVGSALGKALDEKIAEGENKLVEKVEESIIEAEEVDKIANEMYAPTTPSSAGVSGNSGNNFDNEQGLDTPNKSDELDSAFVYGMATVTVVVIISLALIGIMAFKKFNKKRRNYKMGYSQMSEEETRMLKNEYN